jgi:hypothetical protein
MIIHPSLNAREFTKLLKILEDEQVIAVPSDKSLGLCLVTAEWYYDAAWKLLINPFYIEDETDHIALWKTPEAILLTSEHLLTTQQFKWLQDPVDNQITRSPVLKVLPKIHKFPASARPIVQHLTLCWQMPLHG